MSPRIKRNYLLWAIGSAPTVALIYAALALSVVTIGCTPSLSGTIAFGVPAPFFLLAAATLAALIMIVFGTMHALRALRARAQRRQRDRLQRRIGSILIALLGAAVFVGAAWAGDYFLHASFCL